VTSNSFLVSIIIPVYNGSDYVEEAIESALTQTYKKIEVLVVDDGSDDDGATKKLVKKYGDNIRFFEKTNGGCASALNLAISNMGGSFFSWLSHDDIYFATKIEAQLDLIKSENDNSIVYSNIKLIDAKGVILQSTLFNEQFNPKTLEDPFIPLALSLINGCTLLIPRHLIQGGFNEKFRTTQDYQKWRQIFPKTRLVFSPESLVYSRIHPGQDSVTNAGHTREADEYWMSFFKEIESGKYKSHLLSLNEMIHLANWHLERSGYLETKTAIRLQLQRIFSEDPMVQYSFNDWKSYHILKILEKIKAKENGS
jgi:glycosyltransferase involved in cell wall biosynthesis